MLCCACPPPPAWSGYFKYIDRNGTIHFVDDESLVPHEYRTKATRHAEPDDLLPPGEKAELKARRMREDAEQASQRAAEEARKAREAMERSLETPVTIRGNQVLVPVEIGYGGRTLTVQLVLDTGSTNTLLYRQSVGELDLDHAERVVSELAGGHRVATLLVRLDTIKVGPWVAADVEAIVMNRTGRDSGEDGLLGMDFLGRRDYKIDFDRSVIRWAPPEAPKRRSP